MSNNTLTNIYGKSYGNFDITQVMDKADLEGLDLPTQNTEATFFVVGDGDVRSSVKPKVPESITVKILGHKLKTLNTKLYNDLVSPNKTRSIGSWVWSSGIDTEIFSNVLVEKGLDKKGSYEGFSTVILKFIK